MLVDEGTYFLAYDEGRQSETGKYLNIWRRERGEWKIHSNMWNPNAPQMDAGKLNEFATRYTAAWCSQDAARVASFFAEDGSLKINDAEPSVGRAAITAAAQSFMTAFPDMVVKMDSLGVDGGRITYHWTLTGTNTGSGGTGKAVRIQGHEDWRFGGDGLIAKIPGSFRRGRVWTPAGGGLQRCSLSALIRSCERRRRRGCKHSRHGSYHHAAPTPQVESHASPAALSRKALIVATGLSAPFAAE
jgi:ketosteroid isomerase-like protein